MYILAWLGDFQTFIEYNTGRTWTTVRYNGHRCWWKWWALGKLCM